MECVGDRGGKKESKFMSFLKTELDKNTQEDKTRQSYIKIQQLVN